MAVTEPSILIFGQGGDEANYRWCPLYLGKRDGYDRFDADLGSFGQYWGVRVVPR